MVILKAYYGHALLLLLLFFTLVSISFLGEGLKQTKHTKTNDYHKCLNLIFKCNLYQGTVGQVNRTFKYLLPSLCAH